MQEGSEGKMAEYINREDVYRELTEYYHHRTEIQHHELRDALNRIPPADVRPVVLGRWARNNARWCCDKCNCEAIVLRTPYCPNCGADMRGEDDGN
jgi:hypothetical protein